jgi:hypothetical protein
MAAAYKVLGQVNPAATTLTTLYTATLETVCSTLSICNLGVSTTVRVAVRPAGAAIDPKHWQVYDATVNQYDSLLLTLGYGLSATDVVSVQAGTSTVAFSLFGATT